MLGFCEMSLTDEQSITLLCPFSDLTPDFLVAVQILWDACTSHFPFVWFSLISNSNFKFDGSKAPSHTWKPYVQAWLSTDKNPGS